ncbi:formylglycine-generating enzyme family protein [Rhodomicrobium vannielii ATCC 17100]|uniref:formylglycine-generating enzyme family protein n=1 Tax=Rhodomicrobium vannielii TaxID=1069 RepID=UPI00191AB33C|nr:formylglycine-generating enzyme family protein [Rhodomicrobium vannielii]MBJ7533480.1 formylglycine-generating enzyme family protein [Rhodomicrobium vannielii ATCC 17100]
MGFSLPWNEFIWPVAATVAATVVGTLLVTVLRRVFKVPPEQPVIVVQPSPTYQGAEPRSEFLPVPPPSHTRAERDWKQISETEDVEVLTAFISQASDPLWAVRARQRLKVVEEFLSERERVARYKAEGRIEIDAPFVTNTHGLWFLPGAGKTEWFKDIADGPEMVVVPPGRFLLGSSKDEAGHTDDEGPQHEVTITKPFAIARCAVTRGQFAKFVNETGYFAGSGSDSWLNPGFEQDDSHPVVYVNWDDAKAYAKWLSEKTGKAYRLLSEAEWEYACRAGATTPFWWGTSISTGQANYNGNYAYGGGKKGDWRQRTVPAEHFQPNPWGLYQVHGNVWDWCEDCWNANYQNAPSDGSTWNTGDCNKRVLRGGSWYNNPRILRAAFRSGDSSGIRFSSGGFRVARTLNP